MTNQLQYTFTHAPSLADFNISKQAYLTAHPEAPFDYIATSALVLDTSSPSEPRILLLQRAASDSNPNKWEPPGGACDDEDPSILHAAARELWEETGLQASRISGLVGEVQVFRRRNGAKVGRFGFAVPVAMERDGVLQVRLDPGEHQRFVWATEREVLDGRAEGVELEFTGDEVRRTVLLAFEELRESAV